MATGEGNARRGFLRGTLGILAAASPAGTALAQSNPASAPGASRELPVYARTMEHRSLKQSSYDRTGGNSDRWPIAQGATQEVFNSEGPGLISHIWFTIASQSNMHLKELVLRAYWDGNAKPSVE